MGKPMRIRAKAVNGETTVRALMAHIMEGGQRKDSSGNRIPAHHITDVTASHNGKTVLTAQWGSAVLRIRSWPLPSKAVQRVKSLRSAGKTTKAIPARTRSRSPDRC